MWSVLHQLLRGELIDCLGLFVLRNPNLFLPNFRLFKKFRIRILLYFSYFKKPDFKLWKPFEPKPLLAEITKYICFFLFFTLSWFCYMYVRVNTRINVHCTRSDSAKICSNPEHWLKHWFCHCTVKGQTKPRAYFLKKFRLRMMPFPTRGVDKTIRLLNTAQEISSLAQAWIIMKLNWIK